MNNTYAVEVKECWGNTDAYKEHQAKTAACHCEDYKARAKRITE